MKLNYYADVRTGLVLSRKAARADVESNMYHTLSLRNISNDGQILSENIETYFSKEPLRENFLANIGDVLIRLSAPYTAVLIERSEAGLLVPSHFAIIRASETIDPQFLQWWLMENRRTFYRAASGGAMMGTISSGYIANMDFIPPSLGVQKKIGELLRLSRTEQQLLTTLAEKKQQLVSEAVKRILVKGDLQI